MAEFPGFVLTEHGIDLAAKCEAGETLVYTKARIGSGQLPPDGNAFSAVQDADVITIYNAEMGVATDAADGNTGFSVSTTTPGASDTAEITGITALAAATLTGGEYFKLHTPFLDFHVYYQVDGVGADPEPAGSIPVIVAVEALDSAVVVAQKTATAIDQDRTELGDLVRIINEKMEIDITGKAVANGDGTATIPIQFSNQNLDQGFLWTEIGIYAQDPDRGEILYSVTNAGTMGDPVPAYGGATAVAYDLNATTKIGSISDVQAVVVPSSYVTHEVLTGYVTQEALAAAIHDGKVGLDANLSYVPSAQEMLDRNLMERNGDQLIVADYPLTYARIGRMYTSPATDAQYFWLPDDRGLFPRYWDHGAGIDPDAASRIDRGDGTAGDVVGTSQLDQFKGHAHSLPAGNVSSGAWGFIRNDASAGNGLTNENGGAESRGKNRNKWGGIYVDA